MSIVLPNDPMPTVSFVGVTVNVRPNPQSPGLNVDLLVSLLCRLKLCLVEVFNRNPGWLGFDVTCRLVSDTVLRVIDWAPEDEELWGGPSDNMITLGSLSGSAEQTAQWLVEFFHLNGHPDARFELISFDGSADVMVGSLFVSGKINVLRG